MEGENNCPECNCNICKPPYDNLRGHVDICGPYGEETSDTLPTDIQFISTILLQSYICILKEYIVV